MRFDRDDEILLERWLTSALEAIHERSPESLVKYIISLLKHDSDIDSLKTTCMDELKTFLKDRTAQLVNDLIDAVRSKFSVSYSPSTIF